MGQHVPPGLAHHIRNLAGLCRAVSQSDADLLTAFVEFGDGESFAALVVRHGQAVWATCRQVLDNDADAEDAFQATFIALARKAGSLRREPLAGWLRKVAHEVALNAYKAARRRTAAHQRLCEYVTPPTAETPSADELSATVREELASLPERLRVPLALFYLDGKPQVEIAELLGVTDRSIRNRLARGLAALRERLANRGVVVTTAVLVAVLGNVPALSALPTSLVALTTASALAVADGKEITTPAAKLAEQVTAAAWSSRFKVLVFLTLVLGIGAGAVALPSSPDARPETPPPVPTPSTKAEERKADLFGDPLPPGAQVRIGTVRFRPGLSIGSATVAIAPDNKTLYSVHGRDEVRVWELTAGKGLQTIPAPKGCRGVAISPDGRRLIATGTGEAWAWDISAGVPQLLWKQKKRGLGDECVAFAPNGLFVACGGDTSNTIHLLDAVTGEERSTLPGRGTKLVFSPNGRTLASSADDEVVRLWDIGTGKERRALTCGTEKYARVNGFVFSPDGRTLVTVTKAGVMSAWDVTSGKECRLADVHSNAFVAFEPDGKTLIEAGAGQIRFRDPATGKESRKAVAAPSLTANVAIGDSCRLSADGKLFVSASVAAIGVWDVRTGKPVGPTDVPAGPVMSVSFSPDGQSVALVAMSANGGWNGSLPPQVYDARTGRLLKEFRFPQSDRPSLRLFRSPVRWTGKQVLITSMQNGEDYSAISHCLVWGDAEEPIAQPAEGVKGRLSQFPTPSPDGELFATPQPKGGVVISERVSGKALHTLKTPWEVMCLAFSADGRSLVCWERKQVSVAASVWDVRTGQKRGGWAVEDSRLGNAPPLAISVDGLRVAIGTDSRGMKGKLQVWDVATESLQWEFTATVNPATAVAFSPDGRMLATGGEDGVVRLWETFTGQERLLLTGHRARIWSLAFAPDGQRLASASADSTALIWETRPTRRSETKVDSLWTALSGSDAAAAYQAILALAETPKTSLPLLRQWLKPPTPEPGQVEKWVTELGADRASVRDAATFALTAQGDRVEAVLRKALKDNPTPEARKRLTKLIDSFGPASPWKLGVKRGVEALERMSADPEARKLLAELAKEPVDDFQKKEVEAARERLPGSE